MNQTRLTATLVGDANEYWVSPVKQGTPFDIMDELQKWVQERELGRRISYNIWRFKDQESYTTFLLAWC